MVAADTVPASPGLAPWGAGVNAIGTGRTATSNQAEEMHRAIRLWIQERYGNVVSELIPILYGGSCNPSNAKELFACPNVDGGLIGGASLDAASFISIAQSF